MNPYVMAEVTRTRHDRLLTRADNGHRRFRPQRRLRHALGRALITGGQRLQGCSPGR